MTAHKTATVSSLKVKVSRETPGAEVQADINFHLPGQHPEKLYMKVEFWLPKMPDMPAGENEDAFLFEALRLALTEPLIKLTPTPPGTKH